jgi:uncharacterized protein (TIGR03435 family)
LCHNLNVRNLARIALSVSLLISSTISAQPPSPHFEVASVKPSQPDPTLSTPPVTIDPARVLYHRVPAKILIQIAYRSPDWAISGGPAWLASDLYDVTATLPPGSSQDQVPDMLRTLLEERFHLATQHETRQMPVLALTVANNGPKLKPGDEAEQWVGGNMKGGIFKGRLELHQITMGGLAEVLAGKTGRPVIDRTHLIGFFDVSLTWTPEDTTGATTTGPSIYTALQEQLGLKLQSDRAPVDILVISHIEKPSEN